MATGWQQGGDSMATLSCQSVFTFHQLPYWRSLSVRLWHVNQTLGVFSLFTKSHTEDHIVRVLSPWRLRVVANTFYMPRAFLLGHTRASLKLQNYALTAPLPKRMTSTLDEGDELGKQTKRWTKQRFFRRTGHSKHALMFFTFLTVHTTSVSSIEPIINEFFTIDWQLLPWSEELTPFVKFAFNLHPVIRLANVPMNNTSCRVCVLVNSSWSSLLLLCWNHKLIFQHTPHLSSGAFTRCINGPAIPGSINFVRFRGSLDLQTRHSMVFDCISP